MIGNILGKIIEVNSIEYVNAKKEKRESYKITFEKLDFEGGNKKYKGFFGKDFITKYLEQNKTNLKNLIQNGEPVVLTLEDREFKNDKDELIKFKGVKYFNLLDENGLKILYQK